MSALTTTITWRHGRELPQRSGRYAVVFDLPAVVDAFGTQRTSDETYVCSQAAFEVDRGWYGIGHGSYSFEARPALWAPWPEDPRRVARGAVLQKEPLTWRHGLWALWPVWPETGGAVNATHIRFEIDAWELLFLWDHATRPGSLVNILDKLEAWTDDDRAAFLQSCVDANPGNDLFATWAGWENISHGARIASNFALTVDATVEQAKQNAMSAAFRSMNNEEASDLCRCADRIAGGQTECERQCEWLRNRVNLQEKLGI